MRSGCGPGGRWDKRGLESHRKGRRPAGMKGEVAAAEAEYFYPGKAERGVSPVRCNVETRLLAARLPILQAP